MRDFERRLNGGNRIYYILLLMIFKRTYLSASMRIAEVEFARIHFVFRGIMRVTIMCAIVAYLAMIRTMTAVGLS